MKKTRRFVALLLAAVLALALFTACGAAEQPQSAIGKVYEDWFVEQINSKRPGKPVQKVDVKHSEMRTALAKISEDGKFTAGDGRDHEANGCGFGESWYWMILSVCSRWSPQATERVQPGQKQCGKPPFVSVFHTGLFSPAVCGKLPGVRFQIGEKQTRKPE